MTLLSLLTATFLHFWSTTKSKSESEILTETFAVQTTVSFGLFSAYYSGKSCIITEIFGEKSSSCETTSAKCSICPLKCGADDDVSFDLDVTPDTCYPPTAAKHDVTRWLLCLRPATRSNK